MKCSHNILAVCTVTDKNSQHSEHTFSFRGATAPSGPGPHYRGFTITLRHTSLGRTPLDEWSPWRRDLYLTTHNTHKRQTPMLPAWFESTIPATDRPQTHALDRAATRIGRRMCKYSLLFLLREWTVTKYETNPKLSHVTVALQKPGFMKLLSERSCLWLFNWAFAAA